MKYLYPFVIILVFTFLGELLNYFLPMEQEYFTKTDAAVRCDMIWEVWE